MPLEIERKFLVKNDSWKTLSKNSNSIIIQGYLSLDPERTVRVRIKDSNAFITIKGKTNGITRLEFEYNIPIKEAKQLLTLCEASLIEKIRHEVIYEDKLWEIDVFSGKNEGLIVAEIELKTEEEQFELPDWIGKEVSSDALYYNASLVINPYSSW